MKVASTRCGDYGDIRDALDKALSLIGGIKSFVKPGQTVLLKPNLCDPLPPEKAATTHPLLVKAVIEQVKLAGATPVVGELSAGGSVGRTAQSFKASGIETVCKESNTGFWNFQEGKFVVHEIKDHKVLEKTDFPEAIAQADCIINIPKLKAHGITYLTGAVKNFFGCLHSDEREYLHKFSLDEFSQGIVDVYSHFRDKVVLNIMDAVAVMEGDESPSYGDPLTGGYLLASADAVSVDVVSAELTGHKPLAILTTKYASERSLGDADAEIMGDPIVPIKGFKQHTHYVKRNESLKGLQPEITDKCTKCGVCFKSCPVNAISEGQDRYVIDEDRCIQCYCCQEVCIYAAIRLKRPRSQHADLIRLGQSCNQRCLFCTVANDEKSDMDTKHVKSQIDFLAKNGSSKVAFTGGEPTIREDIVELVQYTQSVGLQKVEIQTNAALLADSKLAKDLVSAGASHFFIALHSHKESVSDQLTKSKLFSKTIQGIRNVLKEGASVVLSHVINSHNYKDLPSYVPFISRTFGSDVAVYFGFVRPNGAVQDNPWIVPRLSKTEHFVYSAFASCKDHGISFLVEGMPLCYMQGYEEHNDEVRRSKGPGQFHIEDGEVREDTHHQHMLEDKSEGEACRVCVLKEACPKVWKEYAETHGTDELFPVFDRNILEKLNG